MTYSSAMSMNRTKFGSRNQNSINMRDAGRKIGPVANAVILIVLLCLIGLVYLTQVTKTNAYGYKIEELQGQKTNLLEQQKDLELTAARLRSIDAPAVAQASNSLTSSAPVGEIR